MSGMKQKSSILWAGSLLSLVALYYIIATIKKSNRDGAKSALTTRVTDERPARMKISKWDSGSSAEAQKKIPDIDRQLSPPSLGQVRKEVAENPHSTPISIIDFAAKLGPKMERAFESEAAALLLFDELKRCTLNSTLLISIQTICLSNAQLLVNSYPKLETQFISLKEQASPEAVRLMELSR